tara:strand:- start:1525 stop:1647 length:123 start_codon:yes stop_codon:yes gene_type:complete
MQVPVIDDAGVLAGLNLLLEAVTGRSAGDIALNGVIPPSG